MTHAMTEATVSSLSAITIDIAIEADGWNAVGDIDGLARRAVDAALRESGDSVDAQAELSILLCDDAFIAGLNQKWRGLAKPTNVLSFPVDGVSAALGDIVIAYETVKREATDEHKTVPDHLCHMIVHGFLHLLGFDHDEEAEAEAMEAVEIRALAALGIASPFEDRPKAAEDLHPPQ